MIVNWLYRRITRGLPEHDTMDDYIDFILSAVAPYGEDLDEQEVFLEKRWLEINDRDDDTNALLHIFKPDFSPTGEAIHDKKGELAYLRVVNGNVSVGAWSTIKGSNTMLIKEGARFELFDLAFLNSDFFILKKHRNQHTPVVGSKYLFLANEGVVKGGDEVMPWLDIMEVWFNIYRLNSFYIISVVGLILLVIFVLLLSII